MKNFDLYKITNIHSDKNLFRGVYCREKDFEKYQCVTNGYVFINIKREYPDKYKNKLVDKNGDIVDDEYFRLDYLLSMIRDDKEEVNIDINKIKNCLKKVKPFLNIIKKLHSVRKKSNDSLYAFILFEKVNINITNAKIFIDFIDSFPNSKIYTSKKRLYAEDNVGNSIVVQGICLDIDKSIVIDNNIDDIIFFISPNGKKITDYSYKEYLKICNKKWTDDKFKETLKYMFNFFCKELKEEEKEEQENGVVLW